jgi:hypothetical protein
VERDTGKRHDKWWFQLSPVLHGLTTPSFSPAKSFEEVQGAVSELINDRILIGHAIQNDLKVCILLPYVRSTNSLLSSGPHAITSTGANS